MRLKPYLFIPGYRSICTRLYILLFVLLCMTISACLPDGNNGIDYSKMELIPKPDTVLHRKGALVLDSPFELVEQGVLDEDTKKYINRQLKQLTTTVKTSKKDNKAIEFIIQPATQVAGKEGYSLLIEEHKVQIIGSTKAGLVNGFHTFLQILQLKKAIQPSLFSSGHLKIPCMEIRDNPAFEWRGLMLDCSRTFLPVDYIKKHIDLLTFYKMNVLHLHLTDDQGWRLEIDQYPELTELCSKFSTDYPTVKSGYYSKKEIADLIQYAQARNITIVPEIEMPGHTSEVFAAYPEFSCSGEKSSILPFFETPGITHQVFCAGNEETFTFLENVLSEVMDMFPSKFIHIGGDEVPKTAWKTCPKCQKRIQKEGLANEEELQSYFIKRIEKIINKKGRKMMGWDEIMEGGLAKGAAVMSWRGMDGGTEAAKNGHQVVMSPTSHCYFDYDVKTTPLSQTYAFWPIPPGLDKEYSKNPGGHTG